MIADSEFFTPAEFSAADHHITGRFDEFGQFTGSVTIYGQDPIAYSVAWPDARGLLIACGPFSLDVAVVQGERDETRLDPEIWAELTQKMARIGGLYIYRDNIRVLPYGNNDYDFLDIERNRTKTLPRYYFSYRRMFGVIQLNGHDNSKLKEKAGREGFREGRAYGQFRDILKNFFLQAAIDFFREGGSATDVYRDRQNELKAAEADRLKHERRQGQKRKAFQGALRRATDAIERGDPAAATTKILADTERELRSAAILDDVDEAAERFISAESLGRSQLAAARSAYRIGTPRGVGLSKTLRKDWERYRAIAADLDETVFVPAQEQLDEIVERTAVYFGIDVDKRVRLRAGVESTTKIAQTAVRREANELRRLIEQVSADANEAVGESLRELDRTVQETISDLSRRRLDDLDSAGLDNLRSEIDRAVSDEVDRHHARFEQLSSQLDEARSFAKDREATTDVRALDDEELIALRARADSDLELMQLGTAIQIINHEYIGSVRSMRENLRRLKSWADRNDALNHVYQDLRASFDHLDGYLSLFTPLQRRLYRSRIEIRGRDVETFVRELFEERLARHGVTLVATAEFQDHLFEGFPSTHYPVFVNLVDNAIYWVKDRSRRTIELGVSNGSMYVADSGPGVSTRDLEDIFELGFTRKSAGRGTGLYVSRQVLRRDGYEITASNDGRVGGLGGAVFTLEPLPTKPGAEGADAHERQGEE
ncbi:MAG: ATP-binding protein [Microthrixaceae bacterium]